MTGLLPVLDRRPPPFYVCSKTCYSKVEARTVLNARAREGTRNLRIYYCQKCNSWHVTSRAHYDDEP